MLIGFQSDPVFTIRTQSGWEERLEKTNPTTGGSLRFAKRDASGFESDTVFTIRTQSGPEEGSEKTNPTTRNCRAVGFNLVPGSSVAAFSTLMHIRLSKIEAKNAGLAKADAIQFRWKTPGGPRLKLF